MPRNAQVRPTRPDAELIRKQLDRVLASPQFFRSERLRRFLRFVVEAALDGEVERLKETNIGVEVFDRNPSYDPKLEPVVRVEARRLREKLERYYASEGRDDRIVILLPKGGYVPQFQTKVVEMSAHATMLRVAPGKASRPLPKLSALPYAAAAVILCALIGLMTWRMMRLPPAPNAPLRVFPLTSYPGIACSPSISPDGRQVAYVWDANKGNYNIYVKLIGIGTPIRLTADFAQDLHPAWSPNGQYIAFLRTSPEKKELMVVSALGGPERRICRLDVPQGTWSSEPAESDMRRGPAWSRDGNFLAITDGDREVNHGKQGEGIFLIRVQDGERHRLTSPPPGDYDSLPAFSPNGKFLAFARYITNSVMDLFLIPLAGGRIRQLTFDRRQIEGISWMPDSRSIVYSSNRSGTFCLWRIQVSGGQPWLIAAGTGNATEPVVARDGKRIAYTDTFENTSIWRIPSRPEGAQSPERLIFSSRRDDSPQYSPDGEEIAFVSNRSGSWQIWVCDRDGGNPMQLTALGGSVTGTPRWSPDGQWLAFDSREEGHSAIYLMPSAGGAPKRMDVNAFEESMPSWSRDGKWIYFTSDRAGSAQLWRRPVAGGSPVRMTTSVGFDAMESPDGKWVYFLSKGPGIWKVPRGGGEALLVPELAHVYPRRYWAMTNSGIYFVARESAPRSIQFFSFAKSRIEDVAEIRHSLVAGTPSLTVSPDGKWILYAQTDEKSSDIMMLENF